MALYYCTGCSYVTNRHRSYRAHSAQCSALQKAAEEREQALQLTRKRKQHHSANLTLALNRIRESKRQRLAGSEISEILPIPPSVSLESLDLSVSATPPAGVNPPSSTLPLDIPSYQPANGNYRVEREPLPEAPPDILETSNLDTPPPPRIRRVRLRVRDEPTPYTTLCDSFGQYRVYATKPKSIPDSVCELEDFSDLQTPAVSSPNPAPTIPPPISNLIAPCPNMSTFRLQHWHWTKGVKKSGGARKSLIRDVLSKPDFVAADLSDVNLDTLDDTLAGYSSHSQSGPHVSKISISLPPRTPAAAHHYKSDPLANTFSIPMHSSETLLDAVRTTFEKNDQRFFHYEPRESHCRDPITSQTYRSYGEAYESQRMIDMHRAVQEIKLDVPCDLPRCTAATMIFSDATLVANFGSAKAWPIRVTFGNLSKYERCKPNAQNHHEIGFIPSLPPSVQDKLRELEPGRPIPKALMAHLRREVIHEVWRQLLNPDFLRAWTQGIVIKCADGITRRVFPRIFSYSADYPEKVLLATIRGMKSLRPCPRCLTPREEFKNMGLPSDLHWRKHSKRKDNQARSDLVREARSIIFDEGRAVSSKRIDDLLRPHSYVPTYNAFSRRLRPLGFDIFEALTVDFLHEFELGVWKSVFHHLLRVLHSSNAISITTLNQRFRLIPSFGRDTIRPFSEDVSDMSRPAARNYEDILQCIIPALEGLMPASIEQHILTLLYVLAEWHGLAKLRRHTSVSVDALRRTTTRLGHELREFHRYTSEIEVYETPKEHTTRQQRVRKRARPRAALAADSEALDPEPAHESERRRKYFNLDTVKLHFLADYPDSIEDMGTTDSTSTQTGELIHRFSKSRYARTNGRDYLTQMGKIQRIEGRLIHIQSNLGEGDGVETDQRTSVPLAATTATESLPPADGGRLPYQIAQSQKDVIVLPLWLQKHCSDPATKDFLPRLKAHLYTRLTGGQYQDELSRTSSELSTIRFQHDRIYNHCTLRVHYTTYDVHRAQDTVNPRTSKQFVLLPSHEALDPSMGARRFWYAKVLGIYHANVSYKGSQPKRVDFLWVRWLARMTDVPGGGGTCRLDQVGYFKDSDEFHAFDFVDPADVIRGAHLIPRFVGKQTTEYLESTKSLATDSGDIGDWKHYYLNRFADRDMLMRFAGMAIGHMTLGCTPGETVDPPAHVSNSDYDYTNSADVGNEEFEVAEEGSGRHIEEDNEEDNDDEDDGEDYNEDDGEDEDEINNESDRDLLVVGGREQVIVDGDDVSW